MSKEEVFFPKQSKNQKLIEHSNHVGYEFWMLKNTMHPFEPFNSIINNCRIESFGIHVRCLLDFFLKLNKTQSDDLLALDFFSNSDDWKEYITEKNKDLKIMMIKKRTSKEIAHLTTKRYWEPVEEKQWDFIEVYSIVNELMTRFMATADKEKLGVYINKIFNE